MPTEAFASPLIVWLGPRRYAFPAGRDVTVGRDSRADIRLDGVGTPASPTHMVLHHDGRQWIAVDRSEGGIYVDGVRMSTVFIHDGRAITLGDPQHGPRLVFQLGAPPPPAPRAAPPPAAAPPPRSVQHNRPPVPPPPPRAHPPRPTPNPARWPAQPPPLRPPQPPPLPPPPAVTTAQPAPHPWPPQAPPPRVQPPPQLQPELVSAFPPARRRRSVFVERL